MNLPHKSRSRPYRFFGQFESVVRWREAGDVSQDLATLLIDSEVSRRRLEPTPFEVNEQAVDIVGVSTYRPTNRVTDTYDAGRRDSAREWYFLVRGHLASLVL